MGEFATDQEKFWAGDFGVEYLQRNQSEFLYASNLNFFSKIFSSVDFKFQSVLEFGANIGMNIGPIKQLIPEVEIVGVEINPKAHEILSKKGCEALLDSILTFSSEKKYDLTFTKGVLIHINPDELHNAYRNLYESSNKYILIAEYYDARPVTLEYRGHSDKLFKRDFAGDMLDTFRDLRLVDYGFSYHLGNFPQDDITWFLLEKSNA